MEALVCERRQENYSNLFSAQFDKMRKPYRSYHKHLGDENFIDVMNDIQLREILVPAGNAAV